MNECLHPSSQPHRWQQRWHHPAPPLVDMLWHGRDLGPHQHCIIPCSCPPRRAAGLPSTRLHLSPPMAQVPSVSVMHLLLAMSSLGIWCLLRQPTPSLASQVWVILLVARGCSLPRPWGLGLDSGRCPWGIWWSDLGLSGGWIREVGVRVISGDGKTIPPKLESDSL
jgi:hypothetical protein